jgi:hypothetical protein
MTGSSLLFTLVFFPRVKRRLPLACPLSSPFTLQNMALFTPKNAIIDPKWPWFLRSFL